MACERNISKLWKQSQSPVEFLLYNNLKFFQFDCCSTLSTEPISISLFKKNHRPPLLPLIRLFGVTLNSFSVCCNVVGFYPFFYVCVEKSCVQSLLKSDTIWALNQLVQFKFSLKFKYGPYVEYLNKNNAIIFIKKAKISNEDSLANKKNPNLEILKIILALPKYVEFVANVFETGFTLTTNSEFQYYQGRVSQHEVPFVETFMNFVQMKGTCWLELTKSHFFIRTIGLIPQKESHCQIEVDVNYFDIHILTNDLLTPLPPLRILSIDIEILPGSTFPGHGLNPVIQIGNVIGAYDNIDDCARTIFVMGSCDLVENVTVICFDDEAKMLEAWGNFVMEADPDIITGYNILGFDLPYLLERSIGLSDIIRYVGRLKGIPIVVREACYNRTNFSMNETEISGRIILDVYKLIYHFEKGLPSYKLKDIASLYLGCTKDDICVFKIPHLQAGSSSSRSILAKYCIKDAELAYHLLTCSMPLNFNLISCLAMSHSSNLPLKTAVTFTLATKRF